MPPSFLLTRDTLPSGADLAPLALRLFAGTFLIYMSQDNVLSGERMSEFVGFLRQFGFPAPEVLAPLSVYAQFAAGIALLGGVMTRVAAAVMIVNFVVALTMVHPSLPFREALDPAAMLACSVALLLLGGGRWSVDRVILGARQAERPIAAASP
ncbi:MAG: DoxX family protein [Gemmatimonadaceae bacterium]|nr:DoxX family protein [Gemmatimonadaceae bacterium]